jgi:hypothetical protein
MVSGLVGKDRKLMVLDNATGIAADVNSYIFLAAASSIHPSTVAFRCLLSIKCTQILTVEGLSC